MSAQRAAVYSQRRAFLSSSDDGMLETFTRWSRQTMSEIYDASLVSSSKERKGKPAPGSPVNAEKLVSKALQFFPKLDISISEIESMPPADVPQVLQKRLDDAIAQKRLEVDNASLSWAFVAFYRYLALVQTDEAWCRHLTRLGLLLDTLNTLSIHIYGERLIICMFTHT